MNAATDWMLSQLDATFDRHRKPTSIIIRNREHDDADCELCNHVCRLELGDLVRTP